MFEDPFYSLLILTLQISYTTNFSFKAALLGSAWLTQRQAQNPPLVTTAPLANTAAPPPRAALRALLESAWSTRRPVQSPLLAPTAPLVNTAAPPL